MLLRGCSGSKAENETQCLKSVTTVLDTTKDLGLPLFIKNIVLSRWEKLWRF